MTAPRIYILPIRALYAVLRDCHDPPQNTFAILCSSYDVDESKVNVPHIVEIFDDLDKEVPGRSLSVQAARRIAWFISQIPPDAESIYVCCDSGMSRSSAISAILHRQYGLSDHQIWNNPHYHPNPLVFRLLADCLDMPIDDNQLDCLIAVNRQAFRNAIRKGGIF